MLSDLFHEEGYSIIYIGNGASDLVPAWRCEYVIATDVLLRRCREAGIECKSFKDFHDVVEVLETIT